MLNIAIIDDRKTNRNILSKLTQSLSFRVSVTEYERPDAALEAAAHQAPDLVITDYKMPEMTGADFVARFRQLAHCSDVPVVVVTAYEDKAYRYSALEAGATDFLLTPLDRVEFRARLHNLMTLRRQQQIIRRRAVTLERRLKQDTHEKARALQDRERQLWLVINSVPALVSAVDDGGRCQFINNAQARLFGVRPEAAVGRPVEELFGPGYAERHRSLNAQVLASGETLTEQEETLCDQFGEEHVFLTTKAPVARANGEALSIVTVSVDITGRKRLDAELADARHAAEAANTAKTRFLANMSHDLRTPLNAIIGFAQMLVAEPFGPLGDARYLSYARDIEASGRYLHESVEQILDVSRVEVGEGVQLKEDRSDLVRVLVAVQDMLRLFAERNDVALALDVPDNPVWLWMDRVKLTRAITNFVSNAIKFTEREGRVDIAVRTRETGEVEVAIRDTGIGMSEQDLTQARAPFGRVGNPLASRHDGVGLGLPLALEFVKQHGGDTRIDSAPGAGTTVTVVLPAGRRMSDDPPVPGRLEG